MMCKGLQISIYVFVQCMLSFENCHTNKMLKIIMSFGNSDA